MHKFTMDSELLTPSREHLERALNHALLVTAEERSEVDVVVKMKVSVLEHNDRKGDIIMDTWLEPVIQVQVEHQEKKPKVTQKIPLKKDLELRISDGQAYYIDPEDDQVKMDV